MKFIPEIQVAKCLVLDKRTDMFDNLFNQFFYRLGIQLQSFYAGDGELLPREVYGHIDEPTLPPYIPDMSITYQTWYSRPNAYNAYKSHKKMLEKTLADGYGNVLMVEDDTFLEDDFEQIFEQTEDFFLSHPWDMIYFGGYHQHTEIVAPHILKVEGMGGWHCVLMKTHLIPEILSYGPIGPLDWITGKYIQPKYKCYAIYPCIASQADGHSFVEGHHLSKPARDKL